MANRRPTAPGRRREQVVQPLPRPSRRVALLLFVLSFVVYLGNLRPMGEIDTLPARLLSFSIAREHNFDLDEFSWLTRGGDLSVLLRGADGHLYSRYPVTTPLLAAPLAAVATAWLRHHQLGDDDVAFRVAALVVERCAAALLAALSTLFVYAAAATLTSSRLALATAVAYAFATNTWATSSQALWQHGLAELSLAALSYCLLRPPPSPALMVAAGGWAALGVAARPTMLIFALLATLHSARRGRRPLLCFSLLAIPLALALLAYNYGLVGAATGGYRRTLGKFAAPRMEALFGLLFSPNRGLLVFTPLAVLPLVALLVGRQRLCSWQKLLGAGVGAYLLLYASFRIWWGGNVYGPSFLTDVLPAIALVSIPAVEVMARLWAGRLALLLMLVWSFAVQAVGVYGDDGSWNITPYTISYKPERVWDWRDPQILRAARAGWHGGDFAALLWQSVAQPRPASLRRMRPEDLAGEIALRNDDPQRVARAAKLALRLRVTNRATLSWPSYSDFGNLQVAILARWWQDGRALDDAGEVIRLPRNLGAGESEQLDADILAPLQAGQYQLELLVVQQIDLTQGVFGGAALRVAVAVD